MIFPQGGPVSRHPSQLSEALLEELVLFSPPLWLSQRARTSIHYGAAAKLLDAPAGLFIRLDFQAGWL